MPYSFLLLSTKVLRPRLLGHCRVLSQRNSLLGTYFFKPVREYSCCKGKGPVGVAMYRPSPSPLQAFELAAVLVSCVQFWSILRTSLFLLPPGFRFPWHLHHQHAGDSQRRGQGACPRSAAQGRLPLAVLQTSNKVCLFRCCSANELASSEHLLQNYCRLALGYMHSLLD